MRNLRLLLAMVATIGFVSGVTFRILHWPFGNRLLFVSYLAMILYGLMLLRERPKQNRRESFRFFTGFSGTLLMAVGLSFKLLHYPTANIQILLGAVILCLAFFPVYLFELHRRNAL